MNIDQFNMICESETEKPTRNELLEERDRQYSKWMKERGDKKLTADEIKRIVNIADELLQDANAKDKYISEKQYYEEILKRYNDGKI